VATVRGATLARFVIITLFARKAVKRRQLGRDMEQPRAATRFFFFGAALEAPALAGFALGASTAPTAAAESSTTGIAPVTCVSDAGGGCEVGGFSATICRVAPGAGSHAATGPASTPAPGNASSTV
jgi:hypothetical protein